MGIAYEIRKILSENDELPVSFITRLLNERGIEVSRQKVERVLREMVKNGEVTFTLNFNNRRHYRLVKI
ncbi:hypothetical protein [Palaeococcus ferrophilus]|uniref:hypothetical protein n=1 Tax=Palaeococcus ferrophilus TaxID=83868 RepID=UPI001FDF43D8|nr:hypothetical protein [Palaeococcus ferrophilus]